MTKREIQLEGFENKSQLFEFYLNMVKWAIPEIQGRMIPILAGFMAECNNYRHLYYSEDGKLITDMFKLDDIDKEIQTSGAYKRVMPLLLVTEDSFRMTLTQMRQRGILIYSCTPNFKDKVFGRLLTPMFEDMEDGLLLNAKLSCLKK